MVLPTKLLQDQYAYQKRQEGMGALIRQYFLTVYLTYVSGTVFTLWYDKDFQSQLFDKSGVSFGKTTILKCINLLYSRLLRENFGTSCKFGANINNKNQTETTCTPFLETP